MKIVTFSKDRYRASAAERRAYGGNTVTEFYVMNADHEKDASKWKIVRGFGPTPGDRKSDAIRRSGLAEAMKLGPCDCCGRNACETDQAICPACRRGAK